MSISKKKLLVFIPSIEDGGVEKNLFIILNYLKLKIKDIHLVTFDKSKKNYFSKQIKIINPILNFSFFKGRYPKYILCLLLLIKIFVFDRNYLVLSFQANIYVLIISKIFNLRVISRSNSSSAGWNQNLIKQFIFSYFLKKADKIIVNSVDFKREMDKKFSINSCCILNPFLFKKIKKDSNVKVKKIFSKNALKVITVGRLTLQKDFMTLFKAINLIKKRKIELVVIGKGSEKKNLQNFIKKNNLSNKIKLIGYKKNPFKYINQCQIFILTSIFEGSPNVIIEAQFLKKYIISTNCPTGPREILEDGKYGKLVKIGDYKGISKILENFRFNNAVKKKINQGFKNTQNYDYKINCLSYYNLLKKYI
jgi:glycosyltransferase involved in cell wall biosynthesis